MRPLSGYSEGQGHDQPHGHKTHWQFVERVKVVCVVHRHQIISRQAPPLMQKVLARKVLDGGG